MRIDPPRDRNPIALEGEAQRTVEDAARASSAFQRLVDKDGGGGQQRSYPEPFERPESGGDSSVALEDPDRDEWTQEVIGARIHWQYGPDGRRKPFFRHQTRRLDDRGAPQDDSSTDSDKTR